MGNKSQADERFEKQLRALGFAILRLQKASEEADPEGFRVCEVRIKLDADNRTSVLLIVKGVMGAEPMVAFAGGSSLESAIITLSKQIEAGTVRWRDDPPWGGPT